MQDYLREIEGTLARKKERQSTLLYKLVKQKAEENRLSRLGLRSIPSNPLEVTDVRVVKHVLFKMKQDIGDKIAKLRNPELLSLEKDGEVTIRAKNDDVNHLVSRKNLWERRLAVLTGGNCRVSPSKKVYFGCARGLPEAQHELVECGDVGHVEEMVKDSDTVSEDSITSEDASFHSNQVYMEHLAARGDEVELRRVELEAEKGLRRDAGYSNGGLPPKRDREECVDYILDVTPPPEEEFQKRILEAKKEALKRRIESLRK